MGDNAWDDTWGEEVTPEAAGRAFTPPPAVFAHDNRRMQDDSPLKAPKRPPPVLTLQLGHRRIQVPKPSTYTMLVNLVVWCFDLPLRTPPDAVQCKYDKQGEYVVVRGNAAWDELRGKGAPKTFLFDIVDPATIPPPSPSNDDSGFGDTFDSNDTFAADAWGDDTAAPSVSTPARNAAGWGNNGDAAYPAVRQNGNAKKAAAWGDEEDGGGFGSAAGACNAAAPKKNGASASWGDEVVESTAAMSVSESTAAWGDDETVSAPTPVVDKKSYDAWGSAPPVSTPSVPLFQQEDTAMWGSEMPVSETQNNAWNDAQEGGRAAAKRTTAASLWD